MLNLDDNVKCLQRALLPFAIDLVITRPKPGEYDSRGRWLAQHAEEITIRANVQPFGPRDLLRLPENWRTRAPLLVFATEPLYTAEVKNSNTSDKFIWNGDEYEIQSVEDWHQFGFYRCTALKVVR